MILKQSGFLGAECGGNGETFFGGEDDAAEGVVMGYVVVEGACVLCYSRNCQSCAILMPCKSQTLTCLNFSLRSRMLDHILNVSVLHT